MAKFLDKDTGLPYFWSKLKALLGARSVHYTSVVSCVTGNLSATFTDTAILETSGIFVEYKSSSEDPIFIMSTTTTNGQCVITFPALTEDVDFRLEVINDL